MALMRQKSTGKIFNIERGNITEVDPRVAETDIPQQFLSGLAGSVGLGDTQLSADIAEVNPVTSGLGKFSPDIAGVLTGGSLLTSGARSAGAARAARVGETVRKATDARRAAASANVGGIPGAAASAEAATATAAESQLFDAGLRSVGAAERQTTLQTVRDLFTSPADLTETQIKSIPEAERLGFMFLPGQIQGSKLLLEGIKSDSILRDAVEFELGSNRDRLQSFASNALGIGDQPMDADALGLAASTIGDKFDLVRDGIDQITIGNRLAQDIAPLMTSRQRAAMGLDALEEGAEVTLDGRAAMEVRSRLNGIMSDEWRAGRGTVAEDMGNLIEELDEFIQPGISPELRAQWREAKEQWRVLRVLESGKVTDTESGMINVPSLITALKKNFKSEFKRQQFGKRTNLSQETSDFMDFSRVSSAFKDSIGDSGTAGRSRAIKLLTSPKEAAKSFLARKFIEREANRLNIR